MEDNKKIKSFNEHQEKLDISDVIISNKIILDGVFDAKIVNDKVEITFNEDHDRIYFINTKTNKQVANLQFLNEEDDFNVILENDY